MAKRAQVTDWPLLRQLRGKDHLGRGAAVKSRVSKELQPRTVTADRIVKSVCPYCAVGCAQNVYVKDEQVVQIEGDPDAPHSRGRLCPKGSATLQLTTGDAREQHVLYRAPYAADWERLDLETAMEMVTERIIATREAGWEDEHEGKKTRRCTNIAALGGATLDNEENYLIKKLFTGLGITQIENQARVCHSSTVVGLGTSFGRGASSTLPGDLQHSDLIVLEGSNMAEAHPVAFQWVMEAKARGATIVHIDPHYSRTSALADLFVPLRAGTDIAFLGGIINHVLQTESDFREYVLAYTNAPTIIGEDFDEAGADGLFSGYDPEKMKYDPASWQYEGAFVAAASGQRDQLTELEGVGHEGAGQETEGARGEPTLDETLQHPRCVWQILKRHYASYTPEMVERVCGVPPEVFARVCELFVENSGRERTAAFVHGVGWTQHTTGSQYIRAASILQLLLGNMGRPGGGVMAMRGHASIQGSSDIPTLFDTLPGYIPMPHAHGHETLDRFIAADAPDKGFWGNMRAYTVSLLKAWWGDSANAENDYRFDYLPRLTGNESTYDTVMAQVRGEVKGYFLLGQNPAVGSANARMQRLGMSKLDWLVVRDFSLIESATWWKDGPEIESGELRTEDVATEVFFFPAAAHIEKNGTFTNTQRMVQWHHQAQEPKADQRSELWFMYHLGRRLRERLADSGQARDRPLLELTWEYPTEGPFDEPSAEAVLAEISGRGADGTQLSSYTELKDDGTTASGCWIYCGAYADGVNQTARRRPRGEQSWLGEDWAWAWPANRRILYNRASADPEGRPWSERKKLVWWDAEAGKWTGYDVPDFQADKPPSYRPPEGATGPDAIAGDDPFIMQADGRGWLFAPAGVGDGPLPTHYEAQDSPVRNRLHRHQRNPARQLYEHEDNRYHPAPDEPGADAYPFVLTTYRLTEHFTAGGMSRWTPYLAELQPELFCEVSPELAAERALEHAGWATLTTARGVIEARVMVTDRMTPLRVDGRIVHQIGMPYHWGPNGYARGDAMNELSAIALDPSSHIQEVKALTVDIRPGRRPRGAARTQHVRDHRDAAGVTARSGTDG
ncbi:molybdopterin-dependent oxidoreductase [Paraconexibacter antarcticus]|uniref:Molybdopterin-dependent oxidoreductase n=1 Tax=Paraconexibacter antarcticus TaxID=2949664 RepID=A0ABY5DXM2_9ACTN|nr:formate dehydrogenase [Paraconexibacter antarcticus]UTI66073.1 molybdopterin-dependent oxidoreductase [Paraconexibacter antarcticus]